MMAKVRRRAASAAGEGIPARVPVAPTGGERAVTVGAPVSGTVGPERRGALAGTPGPVRAPSVRPRRRLADVQGEIETRSHPGARPPDRTGWVQSSGLGLWVNEWGERDAPMLGLVHGGFDFSRTFDVFAPMLADAGW